MIRRAFYLISTQVSGEVEIWYQWYNPLLDFEPFTDVESDKAPNVLRVKLSQGRGLAVMDKILSKGGSSDPRWTFRWSTATARPRRCVVAFDLSMPSTRPDGQESVAGV